MGIMHSNMPFKDVIPKFFLLHAKLAPGTSLARTGLPLVASRALVGTTRKR